MALATLSIDLVAKLANLQTGMDKAVRLAEKDAARMERAFSGVKAAASAIGAGLLAGLSANAVKSFVTDSIDAADAAIKQARAVGLLVEDLTALQYAADLSGVSQDELATALTRLSKTAKDAGDGVATSAQAFDQLGIKVTTNDGRLKNSNQLLAEISDRFAALPDGIEKTALAQDLFWRSGAKLISLLNGGAAGLDALKREAQAAGVVISTETAEASEKFNDSITRLQKNIEGLQRSLGALVVGPLNDFIEKSREFFGGDKSAFTLNTEIKQTRAQLENLRGLRGEGFTFAGFFGTEAQRESEIARLELQLRGLEKEFLRVKDAGAGAGLPGFSLVPVPGKPTKARGGKSSTSDFAEQQRLLSLITTDYGSIQSEAEMSRLLRQAEQIGEYIDTYIKPEVLAAALNENNRAFLDMEKASYNADESVKDLGSSLEKTSSFAQDMGLAFSSAFEDAIVAGGGLRDLLRGLEQDVVRIVTRKLVTEPLGNKISGLIDGVIGAGGGAGGSAAGIGSFLSGLFSGFFADGGYVPPGRWGIAGERGPEPVYGGRTGLTVSPAGASVTINQHFARGTDMRTVNEAAARTGEAVQRALARNR